MAITFAATSRAFDCVTDAALLTDDGPSTRVPLVFDIVRGLLELIVGDIAASAELFPQTFPIVPEFDLIEVLAADLEGVVEKFVGYLAVVL